MTASVAEAAVVGIQDDLTGQAVTAFVALKHNDDNNEKNDNGDSITKALVMQVRKSIGPFAAPRRIYIVPDLPKTRSGKIMRRVLRKILEGQVDGMGDVSTVSGSVFFFLTEIGFFFLGFGINN